jgi:nucleoside-diphosphate-sugar epimerase/predicted dehydrogenase
MSTFKVGILGAGYISDTHVAALHRTPRAEIVALCDRSSAALERLAHRGVKAEHYSDLDAMLAKSDCNVVHVLTSPDHHFTAGEKILASGRHAFIEKPLALSLEHCLALAATAERHRVIAAVTHNFLWMPAYEKLREALASGVLGPVDNMTIEWQLPLRPLRSGPYGIWLNRTVRNVLFEILPHPMAFVRDLLGQAEIRHVEAFNPIDLPTGVRLPQGLGITARAGDTLVNILVSFAEGGDRRTLSLRAVGGHALLDYANNTLIIEPSDMGGPVTGALSRDMKLGARHIAEGVRNSARELRSAGRLAPFPLSIERSVRGFYAGLPDRTDPRHSISAGSDVMRLVSDVANRVESDRRFVRLGDKPAIIRAPRPTAASTPRSVLVLGGTGYIGRHLVEGLATRGHRVQVFSRGTSDLFQGLGERVSLTSGNLMSEADLLRSMNGVDTVYHLARANEESWEGYLKNDIGVTALVGACATKAGVRRLIYTGSIASYDASGKIPVITEDTPLDDTLSLYARAKAACEQTLMRQHRENGLPIVIARPGIVVGRDGPLMHWGVAFWQTATRCTLWGSGTNPLPFVSIDDTVDCLIRMMEAPGIEGQSFNIVGDPLLSARQYLDAISQRTGVKINYTGKPVSQYFAVSYAKYLVKKATRPGATITPTSYADWASRSCLSRFANDKAKRVLGWTPAPTPEALLGAVIDPLSMFGHRSARQMTGIPGSDREEAA